ncbi:hypothetical protein DOU09_04805 [Clavibacter michiganensis subsp. michiganensis]|uniref:Uncharacterized protein n=1 Tax=Clavibacter michiganensis subsp. michiganensis (strain NCPPB 382) TaxID=443906 RepID=A5CUQ5_CLAM3|nr:hypothetical protein [Clavibacter michiganensis subsp. michiganensis]CAN02842.1 hypothetical protein CMM_2758 [Clavibacter michiganensis subsp. michiganensis NCPPB 382]MWJ03509.1 hypothetical protein [Clavibacter michiganensis subsp. michiganensis]MWJ09135.1 hypothetical protein [Clavibacter michiganensis subsp. michiganensis]MWJ12182.1 hypothetical protein [Clavibacter michiganensis subsp. michiganensis]
MPHYIVNKNAQPNGDREVHNLATCNRLPLQANRVDLGSHASCSGAVSAARRLYNNVNGCAYCSSACHTS